MYKSLSTNDKAFKKCTFTIKSFSKAVELFYIRFISFIYLVGGMQRLLSLMFLQQPPMESITVSMLTLDGIHYMVLIDVDRRYQGTHHVDGMTSICQQIPLVCNCTDSSILIFTWSRHRDLPHFRETLQGIL